MSLIRFHSRERNLETSAPTFFGTLLVYAGYEWNYLWTMDGFRITGRDVAGERGGALDLKFEDWTEKYNAFFPALRPFENFPVAREQFNLEGLGLARELFHCLDGRHTIIYYPLTAKTVTFEADYLLAA